MPLSSQPVLARPSVLASTRPDLHLPVFQSVSEALAAYEGDNAFTVLYPHKIANMAHMFLDGFPGKVLYAVKANPHPAVLQTLWASGIRAFDVASISEIDLVLSLLPHADLFLMHPIKSRATIRHAYAAGVRHFAFDCDAELLKLIEETDGADDLCLHLRLAVDTGETEMPLTGKFGAHMDEAAPLLQAARAHATQLGVTFHVGSQCLDPHMFTRAIGFVRDVIDAAGVALDSLDCGGGFPVAYPGMTPPAMADYFQSIRRALKAYGFGDTIILGEPGRALCAEGGSTLARVELRKGRDLYLNDGTYGTLFDAGVTQWRFPVKRHQPARTTTEETGDLEAFSLFGPTCDSIDRMEGPFLLPANIAEGDWVEFGHLGAYGQVLGTDFNGFGIRETFAIMAQGF